MKSLRFLLGLLVLVTTTTAHAAEGWRVVVVAGDVSMAAEDAIRIAVNAEQIVPPDSWVQTGAVGRLVVVRDDESIVIAPNSRVRLPSAPIVGNARALQTIGSAFYRIGKQTKPHFQVDTPYLAAVVKGTTFGVTVVKDAALVEVSDGVVEVATADGTASALVRGGQSGIVSPFQREAVLVVSTAEVPANMPPGLFPKLTAPDATLDMREDLAPPDSEILHEASRRQNDMTTRSASLAPVKKARLSTAGHARANLASMLLEGTILLATMLVLAAVVWNFASFVASAMRNGKQD